MLDIEKKLDDLAMAARRERPPAIDVRARVLRTLSEPPQVTRLDLTPVAVAVLAVTVAVVVAMACLPAWQAVSDPWIAVMQ